jgi:isopentenyl diphosphate isomerase/L-lactate dehydrogenase-like FMN-dependent dehydrogenase
MRLNSFDHAKARAHRRLPISVFRLIEGGTEEELTVAANHAAFGEIMFRPRAAVQPIGSSLETMVLGQTLSMPIIVGPAGMIRAAHRGGEVAAARAAGRIGTAVGISTMSSYPIEEIAAATRGPVWFQVYFAGGRAGAEKTIARAAAAGCSALLVTVDQAAAAGRERALRGNEIPRKVDLRNALRYAPEMVTKPAWLFDFLRDGLRIDLPNVIGPDGRPVPAATASIRMKNESPTWADFAWIRDLFPGPVVVKGILSVDDAKRAIDHGADGIIVSNHGGNALDSTPATIRVLPNIARAVGDQTEVLMDGGIRRGIDVVKAVALGARAVLVGRAYVWGLAAAGESGVTQMLEMLRYGTQRTLDLLGCPSLAELDASYVITPPSWKTDL